MKRPFALLEVLIALSLVLLCAIPLLVKPIHVYRYEMAALEEMEGERLADWTFSEIKEEMLKGKIPWEKIPKMGHETGPFPLEPGAIQVPGRELKRIERSFTLKGHGEKKGASGQIYRMIYVHLDFRPQLSMKKKSYIYRVPVQRLPKQS